MNNALVDSFVRLRISQQVAVIQQVGVNVYPRTKRETERDYANRVLTAISNAGMIRSLETTMQGFQ